MPFHRVSLQSRFWRKVERSDACWMWLGAKQNGYGVLRVEGGTRYAHVVSWELEFGSVAPGTRFKHVCGNRLCVRPAHLALSAASRTTS
jgi:hypothetical protein